VRQASVLPDEAAGGGEEAVAVKVFYRPRLERKIKNGLARLYQYGAARGRRDALRREYELVRRLEHPSIIRYRDIFESGQKVYLVMDLGGVSLDVLRDSLHGAAPPAPLLRSIVRQLLGALAYLEAQRVSHHDVKPSNVLVSPAGHVLLVDFGVAEDWARLGACQSFYGTPAFQAPEVAGNVSGATYAGAAADIWSLGVLLFFLVTGDYPYHGETVYLLLKAIDEDPVVLPESVADPLLRDLLSRTRAHRGPVWWSALWL
jgi:serine/threonine protein kinase